jgi:hypothetical protein
MLPNIGAIHVYQYHTYVWLSTFPYEIMRADAANIQRRGVDTPNAMAQTTPHSVGLIFWSING